MIKFIIVVEVTKPGSTIANTLNVVRITVKREDEKGESAINAYST
jgi:hypothetical protein